MGHGHGKPPLGAAALRMREKLIAQGKIPNNATSAELAAVTAHAERLRLAQEEAKIHEELSEAQKKVAAAQEKRRSSDAHLAKIRSRTRVHSEEAEEYVEMPFAAGVSVELKDMGPGRGAGRRDSDVSYRTGSTSSRESEEEAFRKLERRGLAKRDILAGDDGPITTLPPSLPFTAGPPLATAVSGLDLMRQAALEQRQARVAAKAETRGRAVVGGRAALGSVVASTEAPVPLRKTRIVLTMDSEAPMADKPKAVSEAPAPTSIPVSVPEATAVAAAALEGPRLKALEEQMATLSQQIQELHARLFPVPAPAVTASKASKKSKAKAAKALDASGVAAPRVHGSIDVATMLTQVKELALTQQAELRDHALEMQGLRSRIAELEATVTAQQRRILDAETKATSQEFNLGMAEDAREAAETALSARETRIGQLEREKEALNKQIQELTAKIAGIVKEKTSLRTSLETVHTDLATERSVVATLRKELSAEKGTTGKLRTENARLGELLRSSEAARAEAEATAFRELPNEFNKLRREREQLEEAIARLRGEKGVHEDSLIYLRTHLRQFIVNLVKLRHAMISAFSSSGVTVIHSMERRLGLAASVGSESASMARAHAFELSAAEHCLGTLDTRGPYVAMPVLFEAAEFEFRAMQEAISRVQTEVAGFILEKLPDLSRRSSAASGVRTSSATAQVFRPYPPIHAPGSVVSSPGSTPGTRV